MEAAVNAAEARNAPQHVKTTKHKIAARLEPEKGRYGRDGPVTHTSEQMIDVRHGFSNMRIEGHRKMNGEQEREG